MTNLITEKASSIFSRVELFSRSGLAKLPAPLRTFFAPAFKPDFWYILTKSVKTPRIALYGSINSGKSAIINAILGEQVLLDEEEGPLPTMIECEHNEWPLKFVVMNSPGKALDKAIIEQAIKYIADKRIDILLTVMSADRPTLSQEELTFLLLLRETYLKQYNLELPVIIVLSSDESDSMSVGWSIPDDYSSFLTSSYVPICIDWSAWEDGSSNIEELIFAIYDKLPELSKLGFAAGTDLQSVKLSNSRNLIWTTALFAGLVCFAPVPGVDAAAIHTTQLNLVSLIARLGGKNEDKEKAASDFIHYLRPYGLATTFSMFNNQLVKVVGPLGLPVNLANAAIFMGATLAIGEAAIAYFVEGLSIEEAKTIFESHDTQIKKRFREALSQKNLRKNPTETLLVLKKVSEEFNANLSRSHRAENSLSGSLPQGFSIQGASTQGASQHSSSIQIEIK
jgi:uncharacterized protein (DUF697 family)